MKLYFLYKHLSPSGKVYIGITRQKPSRRWGHNGKNYGPQPVFYKAIQKYGWDNFEHIVMCQSLTKEQAIRWEIRLIAHYKKLGLCYNVSEGGGIGNPMSEETRKKISKANKGRIIPDYVRKMISESLTGRKASAETKAKIGALHKGARRSEVTKKRLSEAKIGPLNPAYGKHQFKNTVWITNGCINHRVNKNELKKYLASGWVKGQRSRTPKQ
jgi:group I intron endonuclease